MKTKLVAFVMLALTLVGTNPASAVCVLGCPGPGGSFSPPPPGHGGLTIPPPMHQQPATFSIRGSGYHNGSGAGFGNGQEGFGKVVTEGGTNLKTTLNAAGNLCPGTTCTSGNYTFQGSSWQGTETSAGAFSSGRGPVGASANNSGNADVGLSFTKQ